MIDWGWLGFGCPDLKWMAKLACGKQTTGLASRVTMTFKIVTRWNKFTRFC